MCLPDQQLNILPLRCPFCLLTTRPSPVGELSPSQVPACAVWVQSCADKASGCFSLREYGEGSCTTYLGTTNKSFCSDALAYAQPERKPSSGRN